jgi:hypothetical protein
MRGGLGHHPRIVSPMVPSVELEVTPEVAEVGSVVLLRPVGLDDHFLGGPLSLFQRESEDGHWETIYRLFSPHGGRTEPWYEELTDPSFVHSVGIRGAVEVVIPPVAAGTYQIERGFVASRQEPGPHRVVLHALLTVT